MAPRRPRQSASARPRQSGAAQNETTLPAYEPPIAPLNRDGISALDSLSIRHDWRSLKEQLKKANEQLSEVAADVNENLIIRQQSVEDKKAKRAAKNSEDTGPVVGEQEARELVKRTHVLTDLMETKVREVIDLQARIEARENALREVSANAASGEGRLGAAAATQSTLGASQFRSRRHAEDQDDQEDEQSNDAGIGVIGAMKRKAEEHEQVYREVSMAKRYAQHNDYIAFKKMVHDGQHPEEDKPPLPHPSTWFKDPSSGTQEEAPNQEPSEEPNSSDIEAVSERTSINCPLTLLPMKDPVTSKKCPHSFEKDAILEMINSSTIRDTSRGKGGRAGVRAIKCPVCVEKLLTVDDLAPDPALKRKIVRILERQRREAEAANYEDEDDAVPGSQRPRPQEVSSDDDDEVAAPSQPRGRFKSERRSVAPKTRNSEVPRSSAMVVDLEDDSDEEEEDDDGDLYS